jgi:putative hydrolase of the HAD superfamily
LTTNAVEVIEAFEDAERLERGTFLRAWAFGGGRSLFEQLELGEITQEEWNVGYAKLIGVHPDDLMGRYMADAWPAYPVINAAKARAAGIKTAVLSNSIGRSPCDPYAAFNLYETFDAVVFSHEIGVRKPDPRIFSVTLDRLGLNAAECVFVDDTEENLEAAVALGFTPLFALDPVEAARRIRMVFGLPDA